MNYSSLIIFLTNRCKAGCSTCNIVAVPGNTGMLHPDDLDSIFNNSFLAGSAGKYILWTGGEPFESFSSLVYGIGLADRSGFRSEILTAGYWYDKERLHLTKLREAGNFSLRISIDPEHLKFTGIDILTLLISECIEIGIEVNFTVREINDDQNIVSDFFDNVKRSFPEYYRRKQRDHRWIHHIPHVPVSKDDPYTDNSSEKYRNSGCRMAGRDLVIGWDGNIYPCCGLFSLPGFKKYALGNIRGTGPVENKYTNSNKLFNLIREAGPDGLIGKFGSEEINSEKYEFRNQCHACISQFRIYDKPIGKFLSG
ncbi:MAG: SPASM domain-containing protein [Candidatus Aminicenantes bacterium]|nr:SPASM domain-containing protein [Candidatus Aminicenantes bacterium]